MILLALEEALTLLLEGVEPRPAETLPLGDCAGRILAADLAAARDQPPAPVSAMDGYAVHVEDAREGAVLDIVGEAMAGAPWQGRLAPGKAVRIATGGVVPPGVDRIVIQEIVAREGERLRITEAPGTVTFVRAAGSDFRKGETILRAGEALTPARLGLAAAANLGALPVSVRPRVAILPSGDELREPGSALGDGDIVNSAAYAVAALATAWGGRAEVRPILPDDRAACIARLRADDLRVDLIVPLGGASVGDRDVLRASFEALGARPVFDRIAVQPGKPSWHARFADGRPVLGLPGNPASAFVCAHLLLKPLLRRMAGVSPADPLLPARLAGDLPASGPRETYLRGVASVDAEGCLTVVADARQDSNLQTPLAAANILIRRPPNSSPAAPGDRVEILKLEKSPAFAPIP